MTYDFVHILIKGIFVVVNIYDNLSGTNSSKVGINNYQLTEDMGGKSGSMLSNSIALFI